jgi:hypothetical protein
MLTASEYAKKLESRARKYRLNTSDDQWYDLWHAHLDINLGEGNLSAANRKLCIAAHVRLHDKLVKQARHFLIPWQCWVIVDARNSWNDAVYFHTPNPQHSNYPVEFPMVIWGIATPESMKGLIDTGKHIVGRVKFKKNPIYFIRMKAS